MKIKDLKLFIVLLVTFFISSCSNESIESNEKNYTLIDSNFINQTQALDILSKISFSKDSNSHNKDGGFIEKIKDFKVIRDENNKELFYITNYERGGFIILSADNRITPILAYSDTNNFNIEYNSEGLKEWIKATTKSIQLIRNTNENIPSLNLWAHYKKTNFINLNSENNLENESYQRPSVGGDPYCNGPTLLYSNIIVDKNINIEWHQYYPYNSRMQNNNCWEETGICDTNLYGKYPAGCVPVAIAQIMKYHKFPIHYQWDEAEQPYRGENSLTSSLVISDIHNYINSYDNGRYTITYSCDATSVYSSFPFDHIFKSFGYQSANIEIYNSQNILSRLNQGPVILFANNSTNGGHMWICDGAMEQISLNNLCREFSTTKLRMKWGWQCGTNNGWYTTNNFMDFNNNIKMITNINPY